MLKSLMGNHLTSLGRGVSVRWGFQGGVFVCHNVGHPLRKTLSNYERIGLSNCGLNNLIPIAKNLAGYTV